MSKVLINGYGDTFYSKINDKNDNDTFFVWKNNIFNIKKMRLNSNKKIRKESSLKSKESKYLYKVWKQIVYTNSKKILSMEYTFKKMLINNRLLATWIENDKVSENFTKKEILNKYNDLFYKANIYLNEYFETFKKTENQFNNEYLKESIKETNNKIIEFKKQFNLLIAFVKDAYLNNSGKHVGSSNNFFKNEKETLKKLQIKKRDFIKEQKNKKLKINKIDLLKIEISFFEKITEDSHEFEFRLNMAKNHFDYLQGQAYLKNKQSQKLQEIKKSALDSKSVSLDEYKRKIAILKSEYKKNKEESLIKLKSSNAKKRARKIEYKNLRSNYLTDKENLRLKEDEMYKYKDSLSSFKKKSKTERTKLKKSYISRKDDILYWFPQEISRKKYWLLNIFGSIIPGFSAIVYKQYFKGISLLIMTFLSALILAYVFGAMPRWYGNGILGLKKLGWDPSTQNVEDSIIGITNGRANDGRFFLVTGTISLIMLIIVTFFFVISMLNNINVNNLSRIGVRQSRFNQQKNLLKSQGLPYLISIPAFIFIIFIVVVPTLATLLISFTNINQRDFYDPALKSWYVADGVGWPIKWKGFEQYKYILNIAGKEFWSILLWTLIWTFASAGIVIIIGTIFAVLVNQKRIKGKTFFRVMYILPWAIPSFITIMFFSIIFQDNGIFNKVIGHAIFNKNINWLNSGNKTRVLMILLQGWLGHSYMFLLITGMLQSIPKSLYESAKVDGSSNFKQFTGITAPIIISQIAPLLIGQFTFAFNNFGLIYLFNGGGNVSSGKTAGEFDIFISWVFRLITSGTDSRPGAAAAISLIISVFTITPSAILFLRSKSFRGGNF